MEAYVYTPLSTKDSIRVLSLLPGQPGDALRARLTEVQLSKQPVFSALSYCWGEPKFDLILECDAKWLKITKSLAAALNSLRDRTQPLPIWVDQVCIHQQDISERNTQVTLMGKIYSNASTVYLWLGEEREGDITRRQHHYLYEWFLSWLNEEEEANFTSLRLQVLVERLARAQELRDENGDTRNGYQLQQWGLQEYWLPEMGDVGYRALLRLLQRSYFTRGWILQEAALAKDSTMHVGSASFNFMDFYGALACCHTLGFADDIGADDNYRFTSIATLRWAESTGRREELLTLLLRTRSTVTTDPKDKIYCLLGLAKDTKILGIEPNYEISESFENVYRDFALRNIRIHEHLDVLSTPRSKEHIALPSWVPDWRLHPARDMISLTGREQHGRITVYRATGDSKVSVIDSTDANIIGLTGLCVDKVKVCGQVHQGPHVKDSVRQNIQSAINLRLKYLDWKCVALLHTWKPYVTGETREDAFWRSLIAGKSQGPGADFAIIKTQCRAWSRFYFLYPTLRRGLPDAILAPILLFRLILTGLRTFFALTCFLPFYGRNHKKEAFDDLLTCVTKRIIVRTENGYIGLAPEITKEGDVVALLEGGKLPLILRQRGKNWSIIGDCYIHGIMNGEAYNAERCSTMWIE